MSDPAKEQDLAEGHREVVERLWSEPLIEEVAERLPLAESGSMLVAESRCGLLPIRLDARLGEGVRLIALDSSRAMLDQARERADEEAVARQIFFVPQKVDAISYADGVFDVSVCLNGLVTGRQLQEGLAELSRVSASGGYLAVAVPLVSSFGAFYDLLGEAFLAEGQDERAGRLDEFKRTLIEPERLVEVAEEAGLEIEEVVRLSWPLEFRNGTDFLHSPIVRETFFPQWLGMLPSADREPLLRYIGDAIDTYWNDRIFSTGVEAGFLVARVP